MNHLKIGLTLITVACMTALVGQARAADVQQLDLWNYSESSNAAYGGTVRQGVGMVTLSSPAAGDTVVALSSDTADLQVPSSVTVLDGETTAMFSFDTPNVVSSDETATVTATADNSVQQTFGILTLSAQLKLDGHLIDPGTIEYGTIWLPTPVLNNTRVALRSDNPDVLVPTNGTVLAGDQTVQVPVEVVGGAPLGTTATLTCSYNGVSMDVNVVVFHHQLREVTFTSDSIIGGETNTGYVYLNGVAAVDTNVDLQILSGTVGTLSSTTVTIKAGHKRASFTVSTRSVIKVQRVRVSATYDTVTRTSGFDVTPGAG